MIKFISFVFFALFVASTSATAQSCIVFAVTDGDTIKVRCGNEEQVTIRLAGIDAPEKKQPFGQRSTQSLSDLCYQAQATITPKSKDRYGRTVADVECHGRDAGTEQVKAGLAWAFTLYLPSASPLFGLQDAAKAARMGLWADQAPVPPWDWRHK